MPLRVVFYREDERWIAHCLEFDLVGDGETQSQALEQLTEAIELQADASLADDNLRNLFTPADGKIFEMFAAGDDVMLGEFHLSLDSIDIEETKKRSYNGSPDDFPSAVCPA